MIGKISQNYYSPGSYFSPLIPVDAEFNLLGSEPSSVRPAYCVSGSLSLYGLFTLNDTENDTGTETGNNNYGFHCNMQNTSHSTETLPLMLLSTFSQFIGLTTCIVLGVAQYEHTISNGVSFNHEIFLLDIPKKRYPLTLTVNGP